MRRTNQSIRTAGSTVLGGRSPGQQRAAPEATLRPGAEDAASSPPAGSLEALEQEVEELRKNLESEKAEVAILQAQMGELFMRNSCEEYLLKLEKQIQVIENKQVDVVHWRIENVEQVRSK